MEEPSSRSARTLQVQLADLRRPASDGQEVLAVLAPGQGSQRPGQLAELVAGNEATLARWSELAEVDLVYAGTAATADEIRATEVTQPLLAATALLSARGLHADVLAGHSVGGWAAAALAGVISEDDCLRLVGLRGRAVAACCDGTTGMSAVLGGVGVAERLEELGLTAANVNAAGQVVAAGDLHALQELSANPPERARVRPLPVAGAFHTAAMQRAVEALAAHDVATADPSITLVADVDGTVVTSGVAHLRRLIAATAQPVRFDLVWERLAALGVTEVVELQPSGVLTALARRAMPVLT